MPARVEVTEDDRQAVTEALRRYTADGTLTLDEFADRVGVALAAGTRSELDAAMVGLPVEAAPSLPGVEPPTRRKKITRWVVAVMSGASRKGRWRTGDSITAIAVMGGCELDFRRAEIEAQEIHVTAIAVMGGIEITVPEGIEVELTGMAIMGGKNLRLADVPILPGSPRIIVRAFPVMGGVDVKSKPATPRIERGRGRARRVVEQAERVDWAELRDSVKAIGAELATTLLGEQSTQQLKEVPTAPDGTVTIMFSDIAGYSEMTERLGDVAARDVLYEHHRIVRRQVAECGGYEVKVQGDGFMIAFAGVSRALRCAVGVQQSFDEYNSAHPDEPIRVHVGLHTGEAVRDGTDFLGRTVIIASRLAQLAAGGEVLVSSLVRELAEGSREFGFGPPRQVTLKGVSAPQTVYAVDWRS
ncbi:MAG TPA: adenylate/guanylate cyclase domain-containing protein [Acidimicrobiales bacterium]|nr:adenylate/guanylate cyclase domain-containing protein [Acidimicrobiales bacterium]